MPHDDQRGERLTLLMLYDQHAIFTNTVRDHLDCFRRFSGHDVFFCHATQGAALHFSLDLFDAVLIHYSVRLAVPGHLSPDFESALIRFRGLKVLFIQDEYENTWHTCAMINRLGVDVVFTCVPQEHIGRIYARVRPVVDFVPVLTGYLPLDACPAPPRPLAERRIRVGYRGRQLPYHYGKLGQEKYKIGVRMREACAARGIAHDIEWTEEKRIYGPAWLDFIADCRVILGTESGSNVFDFDGSLAPAIQKALDQNPHLTFDDVHDRFLKDRELDGVMNQVSPRIFEAIALRTGLILLEGRYSGVIAANEHYLSLNRDWSNLDEIFDKVRDDRFLEDMTERAYQDVVASGRYTYQRFVRGVMSEVEARVGVSQANRFAARVLAVTTPTGHTMRLEDANLFDRPVDASRFSAPTPQTAAAIAPVAQVSGFKRTVKWWLGPAHRGARYSLRLAKRALNRSLQWAKHAASYVCSDRQGRKSA